MAVTEQDLTNRRQGPPSLTRDDVRDLFQEFIRNRGVDANQGGNQLMADNAELRADKRQLKDKVKELENRAPKEGQVVVSSADAKLATDIKTILQSLSPDKEKQTLEELGRLLKERGELSDKVVSLEKNSLLVQIAEAEGWKVSTLLKLAKDMDLVIEEVEEEVDDPENEGAKKKVQVKHGFVNQRDAAGNVTGKKRLAEELKDFLPSLAKDDGKTGTASEEEDETGGGQGTPYVRQSRGDKVPAKKGNASKDFVGKRYGSTLESLTKKKE